MKRYFSPDFEAALINNLNGLRADGTAYKAHRPEKVKSVAPTEKQVYWLKKKGCAIPATKAEATAILNKVFAK